MGGELYSFLTTVIVCVTVSVIISTTTAATKKGTVREESMLLKRGKGNPEEIFRKGK